MRYRVISPCYVHGAYTASGFVWPSEEEAARLVLARCLVEDPEVENKKKEENKNKAEEKIEIDKPKKQITVTRTVKKADK